MASIVEFEIEGLAGRRDVVSFDLNSDVNVFWGLNGSGKTSLLKILHSALTGDGSGIIRVPFSSARVVIDTGEVDARPLIRTVKKSRQDISGENRLLFEIATESVEEDIRESVQQELYRRAAGLEWRSSRKTRSTWLPHRYLPISRVSDTRANRTRNRPVAEMIDEAAFDQLFARQIQEIWRDYYTSSLVRIRAAQERGLAQILSVVLGQRSESRQSELDMDGARAYALLRQFFQMQSLPFTLKSTSKFAERYEEDPLVRNIVAEVADVQQEVERALEPQKKIESLIASLFIGGKRVELGSRRMSVNVGDLEIPLESLSSGEKQILRILVESVAAYHNCIIIDEPELSMHVDWQHRLVECMRTVNPSAQIILATHSPEVMANLRDAAIFQL